jgi:DNA-binding response OmpR family regulator
MRTLIAMILVAAPSLAAAQSESGTAMVQLSVKPLLCVIDSRMPRCEIEFFVTWSSDRSGYYCLFNDFATAPLRCWSEDRMGELAEPRSIDQDFSYWMTGEDGSEQLATATVEVLRIDDGDRRRRRRAELTAQYLEQNGLSVAVETRGDHAMARFESDHPRAVLLDIMLPGIDGLTLCRELRKRFEGPILMFTARDSDIDQVIGLEAGADDYVSKPADPMVLLARTRALLRRAERTHEAGLRRGEIVLGGLRVSAAAQQVTLDGEPVPLTTLEFELVHLLARHAGEVLSREEIFRSLRGIEYDGVDRSIDGRISKLRRKLKDDPSAPTRIKTIWGKGYLLVPNAWGGPE